MYYNFSRYYKNYLSLKLIGIISIIKLIFYYIFTITMTIILCKHIAMANRDNLTCDHYNIINIQLGTMNAWSHQVFYYT